MTPPPRLIPDINVLLSGLTSSAGPSHDLFQAARHFEVLFVLAEEHFQELQRVLTYPKVLALGTGITPADAFGLSTLLHQTAEVVRPLERYDWPSCPDPKDWYLLDLLMASRADGVVSKDRHLLRLKSTLNLPVYTPRDLVRLGII